MCCNQVFSITSGKVLCTLFIKKLKARDDTNNHSKLTEAFRMYVSISRLFGFIILTDYKQKQRSPAASLNSFI